MRLLIVVQRYGEEVFGGAEQLARMVAEQFRRRGDHVEVLTTRAVSYVDWADWYPGGDQMVNEVRVHRLSVARPRRKGIFDALNARAAAHGWQLAPALEEEWMRLQGPEVIEIQSWLADRSRDFDLTLFFTYLYYSTWAGVRATRSPSILQPTAHDEPPASLTLFDEVFRLVDGFAFGSKEEAAFVLRRFRMRRPNRVVGIGFEARVGEGARFRKRFGLGNDPYLLCVGRTEPVKGSFQLLEFFKAYKRRRPSDLRLVFLGEEVVPLPRHEAVIMTGFVDEAMRDHAIAGATLLVQPSFFESFSMALAEAWTAGVPALVQSQSPVLAGHVARSGAGLPYTTYGEFETALDMLLESEDLRRAMGARGKGYVALSFQWEEVLRRYDELFDEVLTRKVRPHRAR